MDARRASTSRSTRDADIAGAGEVFELAAGVFERVGSTEAPQPPIAVVEMPTTSATEVLADASFVVVLDRISDPGNLGTIIRSAEAAGVDAVVLTAGSVDPYSPKVVRSSAGAVFHVPVMTATIDDVAAAGLVPRRDQQPRRAGADRPATPRRRSHRARRPRDGQRGRRPARRLERLRRPDPAVDHDSAPRTQRVAECGDGRDGARCSKPPGNEIRRARTAGTDRSPAGMRTRRRAGPSARRRPRSRRDPAGTAR